MKTLMRPLVVPFLMTALFALTGCKKTSPSAGGGGGGTTPGTEMRPATMKVYEGSIGTLAPVWNYEYDKDNQLVKYGEENKYIRQLVPGGVQFKMWYGDYESTTLYAYYGRPNGAMNLYEPKDGPRVVSIQTTIWNKVFNQTTQPPVVEWNFGYNTDNQVSSELKLKGDTIDVFYTYDKKNLTKMEFKHLLQVYQRTTVTGYDDKPSPFSAVKGYRWFSYPQNYNDQFAQAFSFNNPGKMVTELWSTTKNAYYVQETTNFSYTYNDKGYPTKIVVSTSYTPETGPGGGARKTYDFTYK